ncbi:MAG: class I SAM-dependent methyltransferase [bacterium]
MSWNKDYKELGLIWGEKPGELAKVAVQYLQKNDSVKENDNLLDIGCGYGRDTFYLSDNLKCKILGIDVSEQAIEIAINIARKTKRTNITFRCLNFTSLKQGKFDVIFASNVYQILGLNERKAFRSMIKKTLKPHGFFFLSTLSTKDPEHYGKGVRIAHEENSFKDEKYIHFCTGEELTKDFGFLNIKELYEYAYDEPRANGETHHHVSWILIGLK